MVWVGDGFTFGYTDFVAPVKSLSENVEYTS